MALSDIKLLPCDAEGNAITSYGSDDTGNNNNVARPVVPHPDAPASGSGASDLVVDFVIDQLPYGEPGKPVDFAPGTHTYTATGYYHAKAVSARIRAVDGATVTINGATPDADGRVSNLDLTTGLNVITATVSKDGSQATYVVNITKVDTDFRGNVMVPVTATANGGTEADNAALTDLDPTTTWTSDPLVLANDWSSSVTGIELHLGEARYVHRVNGWGTPTLPAGKTPVAPAVDNSMYERYSGFNPGEGKWGVNRAQALALQYGVMMPAWVPSESYGRGGFDANERDLTGRAFPMFYDLPIFNTAMMESLGKGAPWALAKAPPVRTACATRASPATS